MLVPAPPHLNIYPFPFNSFFTNFELMCKLPFFAKFAFMRDQHVRIQWRYFITCVVENMDSMFSCIFFVRIAMTCIVPRGYLRGPPLKRSRFLGVVLSGGGGGLYQIRIYARSTCAHALITMEIFHYMCG